MQIYQVLFQKVKNTENNPYSIIFIKVLDYLAKNIFQKVKFAENKRYLKSFVDLNASLSC